LARTPTLLSTVLKSAAGTTTNVFQVHADYKILLSFVCSCTTFTWFVML